MTKKYVYVFYWLKLIMVFSHNKFKRFSSANLPFTFFCFFIDWHNLFIVIPFFNPMFVNFVTLLKATHDTPCHNSREPRSMTTFPLIVIPWHLCTVQAQHNFNGICVRECSLNPHDDVLSAVYVEFLNGYTGNHPFLDGSLGKKPSPTGARFVLH